MSRRAPPEMRRAPLQMRRTPHQPVLKLLVYSKHKVLDFQAVRTHFYAIKRKYILTTPCLHIYTFKLSSNKQ